LVEGGIKKKDAVDFFIDAKNSNPKRLSKF
jgi:hypothetical protein